MIATLLRIGWINLRRDRVALAMTFALPIMFFSIFAVIFGHQGNVTQRIHLPVVDEDQSDYSRHLVRALQAEPALEVQTASAKARTTLLTRAEAEDFVRQGTGSVAIVLPKGLGAGQGFFGSGATNGPAVDVLADVSDPVAPQLVTGLLEEAAFTANTGPAARQGIASGRPSSSALPTRTVNIFQPGQGSGVSVAFSAAGIGVMFLLFSASGAGGSLLDEEESGTLGRLLGTPGGMRSVLAGKWIYLTMLGIAQLTVMFVWGAVGFGLPLWSHLPGFAVMTLATAAAAAGFGLILATLSRSRQQLAGISTILILAMSAVGGSMFPRFLMTPTMQKIGLVTFNAWALDGYIKVFWRQAPVTALWPQVLVLFTLTAAFLAGARTFARRWESL